MAVSTQSEIRFDVKQHVNNTKYSRMFRSLSRDVSGASCDIPVGSRILFGYVHQPFPNTLVAVMSFSFGNKNCSEPSAEYYCDYYHHITYLFVKKDFQGIGYGKRLLHRSLNLMRQHNSRRPVRVQSAGKSIGFFERQGFKRVGDQFETSAGYESSPLFNTMQNMERNP